MIEKRNLRQRRLLVGLASTFFAPPDCRFICDYGYSWLTPDTRVNRGALIEPVRPVLQNDGAVLA